MKERVESLKLIAAAKTPAGLTKFPLRGPEGIHTLKDLLKIGDWMTKVDLKDAYFMIPAHNSNRPLLSFIARGHHYQFTCLPFGLSCAPWVFTKTLKPVAAMLRGLYKACNLYTCR